MKLRMIDTITQAYVSLNTIDEDDYDPEVENQRANLFLELMKSMLLIFGDSEDDDGYTDTIKNMVNYVENSQFFNAQIEAIRPLLCDDNMEVNALRILLFSLARSLKKREDGDLDSVDETYYENDDVIYMHKEDTDGNKPD